MRKELDDLLVSKYPLLYANRHKDCRVTCMYWGFECGDGWFDLIDRLSSKLERILEDQKASGVSEEDLPKADQVKEKMGSLRYYLTYGTDEMYDIINEAERESENTCESCGKPGTMRNTGWITVRCEDCKR